MVAIEDVKNDAKVDENMGVKVEANMDVKGDTPRVSVQTMRKKWGQN